MVLFTYVTRGEKKERKKKPADVLPPRRPGGEPTDCGWGDCSNPVMYEMLVMRGWPPEKVVVGLVTSPENGSGFVPLDALAAVVPLLAGRHPRFGGVMGWEYFNGLPGGRERPWEWARWMTAALGGGGAQAGPGKAVVPVGAEAEAEADPDDGTGEAAPVPGAFEYYSDGLGDDG